METLTETSRWKTMNIFVLDTDPVIAAQYHCDQHINKMILESAQILSSAARKWVAYAHLNLFYKPLQLSHPCVMWAMDDLNNCKWLARLALSLADERLCRFPNLAPHNSTVIVINFINHTPLENYTPPSKFALAMPERIRYAQNLTDVEKYRRYYQVKQLLWAAKGKTMTWTNRLEPEFMK